MSPHPPPPSSPCFLLVLPFSSSLLVVPAQRTLSAVFRGVVPGRARQPPAHRAPPFSGVKPRKGADAMEGSANAMEGSADAMEGSADAME